MTFQVNPEQVEHISIEELEQGQVNLNINKAIGPSGDPDVFYKDTEVFNQTKHNLLRIFNEWFTEGYLPKFLKSFNLIPLSKDGTPYPKYPNIRIIGVASTLMKMYETTVLIKYQRHVDELNILHPKQRGCKPGFSCLENLLELMTEMRRAKSQEVTYRRNRIPNWRRSKTIIMFIDIKKAYDSVDRVKMLERL